MEWRIEAIPRGGPTINCSLFLRSKHVMCRAFFLSLFIVAGPLLLTGCGVPQSEVERIVRTGIEDKMHTKVTSLNLTKESDTKYTGTATVSSGDKFDIQATVEGKMVRWTALPDRAGTEKQFKEIISKQLGGQVQSMELTKGSDGTYTGTATLATGQKLKLRSHVKGEKLMFEAKP
jgi:uncharacterized protein with FMN-binding domain